MWYLHIHFVCAISCFLCAIKITFPFLDSSLNNSILSERWFLCYKHLLHHPQSRWFPVSGIIIFRNTKNSNAFNWLKPEEKRQPPPIRRLVVYSLKWSILHFSFASWYLLVFLFCHKVIDSKRFYVQMADVHMVIFCFHDFSCLNRWYFVSAFQIVLY